MIRAVLFDLDDTLYPEKEFVKSGFRAVAKMLGKKIGKGSVQIEKDMLRLFSMQSANVFDRLFDNYDLTHDGINDLIKAYREHVPNISLYDDVAPVLVQLKNSGIKTGVISDGYLKTQKQKCTALRLDQLVDHIILTDQWGREYWKPHPKAFEAAKEIFDISYDEILYVGDNPNKDFFISSLYPVRTARILRNDSVYGTDRYYKEVTEQFTIQTFFELPGLLTKIERGGI